MVHNSQSCRNLMPGLRHNWGSGGDLNIWNEQCPSRDRPFAEAWLWAWGPAHEPRGGPAPCGPPRDRKLSRRLSRVPCGPCPGAFARRPDVVLMPQCNRMCTIPRGTARQYEDALSCNRVWFSLTARMAAVPRICRTHDIPAMRFSAWHSDATGPGSVRRSGSRFADAAWSPSLRTFGGQGDAGPGPPPRTPIPIG